MHISFLKGLWRGVVTRSRKQGPVERDTLLGPVTFGGGTLLA